MTFALSKKDQSLLLGFLGVLCAFAAWYFVYAPLQEKTTQLKTENITLKADAELYQSIYANLPKYEEGIEMMRNEIDEIVSHYPVYISREDEIMFLVNMEKFHFRDVAIENITMSNVTEVFTEAQQQMAEAETSVETEETEGLPEPVEEEKIRLFKQPVNYSFRCTYKGAKDMIDYLYAQDNKKGVENVRFSYDSETGNLMGTMDLNQYYMTGTEKQYEALKVPTVPKGVEDVFSTISGSVGVDALLYEEIEETDETEDEESAE